MWGIVLEIIWSVAKWDFPDDPEIVVQELAVISYK